MPTISILSPAATSPQGHRPLQARLTSLRGRRLGIRVDHAWRSWRQAADEIARRARRDLGVAEVVVFDPDSRIGRPEDENAKIVAFARSVDAAIVGLGT